MNWEKLGNVHSPRLTFHELSWENLCANLSFTVENKKRNSHKRGWSHFKLNIND